MFGVAASAHVIDSTNYHMTTARVRFSYSASYAKNTIVMAAAATTTKGTPTATRSHARMLELRAARNRLMPFE